ncbi:MAG TPA: DUF3068 domain-containing protein [Jatrophihabitans sp.]|jgi:hypothetical protein|uniref:DUF3068 domain-containing protein n=1 Tax=Jatrophihabitans sp. TaxID=1932789 RepID=UPI002DF8907A|nr:DUF3068 domain-containing protein [Jatrophihabitans sp.]
MRRALGAVLIGLSLFALVLAVLMPTYVANGSKKTPLNLDITQRSTGQATKFNPSTNKPEQVTLRATRVVKTDTKASDSTNTTVFETLCIVIVSGDTPDCVPKTDPRFLDTTTDRVTANRRTAESVHVDKPGWEEKINGQPARHTGLSYKFPIDTKKQTYQFFQPDVAKAFPAVYQRTTTIHGLTVYEFTSATGNQPYQIQHLFPGTYNDTRTVWVEPTTGAIIDGRERQVQTLADGTVALDTTLSFDDQAVNYQTDFAQNKINQLRVAQLWAPIALGVLGLAALAGGIALLRRRHGASGTDDQDIFPDHTPQPDAGPDRAEPDNAAPDREPTTRTDDRAMA